MRRFSTALLAATFLFTLLAVNGLAKPTPTQAKGICSFGSPIAEHGVLRPRQETFYSADALNPDAVRVGKQYRLYFSGNDRPDTHIGHWRTGFAVSNNPLGPFRVTKHVFPFLNGGTVWNGQRFYQAANRTDDQFSGALFTSSDGIRWKELSPFDSPADWSHWRTDPFIYREHRGFSIYFAARPGPVGADLAVARYASQWSNPHIVLRRSEQGWDSFDLGEPAVFRLHGRRYMLYVGMAYPGGPRRIGLAYYDDGWQRCGKFIDLGPHYQQNVIDPEPLMVGNRLYVFFGGGSIPSDFGGMQGTIWVRVYRI